MTLNEAYEMQRKEIRSLKKENDRLKKQAEGKFTSEEKESLERHIRHLEDIIKSNDKKYKHERDSWKCHLAINRDLNIKILELKEQVSDLSAEVESLQSRLQIAENEINELNGSNARLLKKLNTDFENSSLPSSALPFRKRVPNSRKPSGKTPGAQKGHRAHNASRLLTTKEPVIIPPTEEMLINPDIYPTGKKITKQLIDISVSVNVTDYIAEEYRNRKTGTRCHAPFPKGIVNDVNYGPSVKAFAFLLNSYYNVSIAKTRQCISDITRGVVNISTGTIYNLLAEFSSSTKAERAKIFSLLTHSDILYSDATVSNINGSRKAVILCTDKEHVLYQHLQHKGHDGLSKTPVMHFEGTIIHDHDKSYYSYGSSHQECLAHVLRYLVGAIESEPKLNWHKQMHALLQKMIHIVKNNKSGIPKDRIRLLSDRYISILDTASEEYEKYPPNKYFMDGFNLFKRLRDYAGEHLYFLSHPKIDCTNNISERALRKFKRKQKQAVVFRSDAGGQFICDALSILETAKLQHRNIFDVVLSAFAK